MLADFEHDHTQQIVERIDALAARDPEQPELRAAADAAKHMIIRVVD